MSADAKRSSYQRRAETRKIFLELADRLCDIWQDEDREPELPPRKVVDLPPMRITPEEEARAIAKLLSGRRRPKL